jgi:hypothetical protein
MKTLTILFALLIAGCQTGGARDNGNYDDGCQHSTIFDICN